MASLGLLGAIGGLGQGLTQVGRSWEVRREKALEYARELAKQQKDLDYRGSQRELDRQASDARAAAAQEGQTTRTKMNIEARHEEKASDRQFKSSEGAKARAASKELVKLRGQIERDNTAASERLKRKLSAGDVRTVQYGAPNAQGYAEVIIVTKEGKIRRTGQLVFRPATESQTTGLDAGDNSDDEGL